VTFRAERIAHAWDAWLRAWGRLGFDLALEVTAREHRAGRNW
jgi:hypothetical protein